MVAKKVAPKLAMPIRKTSTCMLNARKKPPTKPKALSVAPGCLRTRLLQPNRLVATAAAGITSATTVAVIVTGVAQQEQADDPNQVITAHNIAQAVEAAIAVVIAEEEKQYDDNPPIITGAAIETAHTKSLLVI